VARGLAASELLRRARELIREKGLAKGNRPTVALGSMADMMWWGRARACLEWAAYETGRKAIALDGGWSRPPDAVAEGMGILATMQMFNKAIEVAETIELAEEEEKAAAKRPKRAKKNAT